MPPEMPTAASGKWRPLLEQPEARASVSASCWGFFFPLLGPLGFSLCRGPLSCLEQRPDPGSEAVAEGCCCFPRVLPNSRLGEQVRRQQGGGELPGRHSQLGGSWEVLWQGGGERELCFESRTRLLVGAVGFCPVF